MNTYPQELRQTPSPVLGLMYLPQHHKNLISTLAEMEGAVKILAFESEAQLTKRKPKRSYDGYKPDGIFKRDWMRKHQEAIPAVIIVLMEWKVNGDWKQQEVQSLLTLERVKSAISGRNTKIVALFVTDGVPQDNVEQQRNVDDFLNNVRKVGQLESKGVTYIQEMELSILAIVTSKLGVVSSFYHQYYKGELDRYKKLKNEYKKNAQPYLLTRHRFKAGFISEILRVPLKDSLKLYTQAYQALLNVSTVDYKEHEIKMMSDYLNYKCCWLKLLDQKIDAATKQFLKHISWYREMKGDTYKIFLHYAGIYRQYRTFGELLETQMAALNPQKRYQNPGFYFQAAASAGKQRRIFAKRLCEPKKAEIEKYFAGDLTNLAKDIELSNRKGFIGQDTTLLEKQQQGSAEDLAIENLRPYAKELLTVNHSDEIIQMLSNAYNHFKKYQTLKRLIYYLANNIAEEHYSSQQYDRAKQFFDRIAKKYRKEKWYDLLTSVLKHSMECARKTNLSREFLEHSIELVSTRMNTTAEEKKQILQTVQEYLQNASSVGLTPLETPLVTDVEEDNVLLSLKVQFENPSAIVYSPTNFTLQFRSYAPVPLKFQRLQVAFSDTQYSIDVSDGDEIKKYLRKTSVPAGTGENGSATTISTNEQGTHMDLTLVPNGSVTTFSFPLEIKHKQELQCTNVVLTLGTNPHSACFRWKMLDNKYHLALLKNYDYRNEVGQDFVERPVIKINEPEPKLTVDCVHQPPALINEHYVIRINLNSNSDHVTGGSLKLTPESSSKRDPMSGGESNHKTVNVFDINLEAVDELKFGEIKPNSTKTLVMIVQCVAPGHKKIHINVDYATTIYDKLNVEKEFDIEALYPFDGSFRFMSTRSSADLQTFYFHHGKKIKFYQKVMGGSLCNIVKENQRSPYSSSTFQQELDRFAAIGATPGATPTESEIQSSKPTIMEGFPVGESIIMQTSLECTTPYALLFQKSEFIPEQENIESISSVECNVTNNFASFVTEQDLETTAAGNSITSTLNMGTFRSKRELDKKDKYSLVYILRALESGKGIQVGKLRLTVARANPLSIDDILEENQKQLEEKQVKAALSPEQIKEYLRHVNFEIPLPAITIYTNPVSVMVDAPSEGVLGDPIEMSVTIQNNTYLVQDVRMQTIDSDAFFFAGTTEIQFPIIPYESRTFRYTLIPIIPGQVFLPRFIIMAERDKIVIHDSTEFMSVFITPAPKVMTEAELLENNSALSGRDLFGRSARPVREQRNPAGTTVHFQD